MCVCVCVCVCVCARARVCARVSHVTYIFYYNVVSDDTSIRLLGSKRGVVDHMLILLYLWSIVCDCVRVLVTYDF